MDRDKLLDPWLNWRRAVRRDCFDTIKAVGASVIQLQAIAQLKKAYAALLTEGWIKGYTSDGLNDQLAANTAALKAHDYGKDVKLVVVKRAGALPKI